VRQQSSSYRLSFLPLKKNQLIYILRRQQNINKPVQLVDIIGPPCYREDASRLCNAVIGISQKYYSVVSEYQQAGKCTNVVYITPVKAREDHQVV